MDSKHKQVTLYTSQTDEVVKNLLETGNHYVKMKYILQKYEDVSEVFLEAYSWYAQNATLIVPRPELAESAVWAFLNLEYLEHYPGSQILKLSVPIEKAVFFRMHDLNKILNLRYIGDSREKEDEFAKKLARHGIVNESDAYTTPFYPHLKKEIRESWKNLFRHDSKMKQDGTVSPKGMQAGLWCLKREWIVE